MAKEEKKRPKEASSVFHNIMAASVKGNPKPKKNGMKNIREDVIGISPQIGASEFGEWGDMAGLKISVKE